MKFNELQLHYIIVFELIGIRIAARLHESFLNELNSILAQMMTDDILIPVPSHLELHGRCRCGVLLSPCFGALSVADLIVGMDALELHYRCRGRKKT